MKRTIVFVLTIIAFSITSSFAQTKKVPEEVITTGDRGTFEYTKDSGSEQIFIWKTIEDGKSGSKKYAEISGTVTSKTKIIVLNKKIERESIDLLNGKEVVVFAKMRRVGLGEGCEYFFDEIMILLMKR